MLDEWATENFWIGFGNIQGPIDLSLTPMIIEPLRELSPQSKTQHVTVKKPAQLAGTTIALIFMAGSACRYPGPLCYIGPTDTKVRALAEKRLKPTIQSIPALQRIMPDLDKKVKGVKILDIPFPGGFWTLAGGQSGNPYRSDAYRYFIGDDWSSMPMNIAGEGSGDQLADRRMNTYGDRAKSFYNSTVLDEVGCSLKPLWDRSSQGYFSVPCPICNHYQYLEWGGPKKEHGIKFTRDNKGQIIDIWYQCKGCGGRIDEYKKPWMMARWKYIHKYPERKRRGFTYNAFYTPLGWLNSWKKIATDFIYATKAMKTGNHTLMQAVVTTLFAEWWSLPGTKIKWKKLQKSAITIKDDRISSKIEAITAGVDCQDNRIAVSVVGWGDGSQSWVLWYREIYGSVREPMVWRDLDKVLARSWTTNDGRTLQIESCAIDSGDGDHTVSVYGYTRTRFPVCIAIKGSKTKAAPPLLPATMQTVTFEGEKLPGEVYLQGVGMWSTKTELMGRLQIQAKDGPGVIHFSSWLGEAYFKQLGNERLTKTIHGKTGQPVQAWVRSGPVEAADTWRYAFAAAHRLEMPWLVSTVPPDEELPPPAPARGEYHGGNDEMSRLSEQLSRELGNMDFRV